MDSSRESLSSYFFSSTDIDIDTRAEGSSGPIATDDNTETYHSNCQYPFDEDVRRDWTDLLTHPHAQPNTFPIDTRPISSVRHSSPLTIDPQLLAMSNDEQQQFGAMPTMNIPTFTAINGGQSSTAASGVQHSSAGPSIAAPAPSNAVFPVGAHGHARLSPLDVLAEAASNSPHLPTGSGIESDDAGDNSESSGDNQPIIASNRPPPPPSTIMAPPLPAPAPAIPAALPAVAAPAPRIPAAVFANSVGQAYNRRWMIIHNIGQQVFNSFNQEADSKLKLDFMGRYGAIVPGDVLRVIIRDRRGGQQTVRDGRVMTSTMDIQYATRSGNGSRNLYRCTGPTPFIQAIAREFPRSRVVGTGWKAVRVIDTNGQDLGSLWTLRQWIQLWVEEYDEWAARTPGAQLRRTRADAGPRPNVQVRHH